MSRRLPYPKRKFAQPLLLGLRRAFSFVTLSYLETDYTLQGLGIVGLGSFAFHGTLLYSAQLADELPMVLSSSWSCFIVYDTEPTFIWAKRSYVLMTVYVLTNAIFAVA